MMHKLLRITVIFAVAFGAISVNAQQAPKVKMKTAIPSVRKGQLKAVPMPQPVTGFEAAEPAQSSVPAAEPTMLRNVTEEIVGTTGYDRQSNGSEQKRLHVWPDGEVSAAWTMSQMEDGTTFDDRGTGYNRRSAWNAGTQPTTRVETVRTGFSNYVVTEDGTEITIAHRNPTAGKYYLRMARKAASATTWVESDIPSSTPNGALWCKTATDGNNLYVLAITAPTGTATGGTLYKGMNGHLLFWRSPDAGATWDIIDGIIPGVDSSAMFSLAADSYAIDAYDGTLAVAVFDSWNDHVIYKSYDGGTNWEDPIGIIDFPLDRYHPDAGYTTSDIGGIDPNAANLGLDSLSIFTSDGNVSLLVDNYGLLHVWAGRMWVVDANLTDGQRSYYPGINGLMYWSEYDPTSLYLIAGATDDNNNDTLDITGLSNVTYGCNMSSMASSAMATNDSIYVAYSVLLENKSDNAGNPYRHVKVIKSADFGQNWSPAFDAHYVANDPIEADFQEGVHPFLAKRIGDDNILHMVYQRDFKAGSGVINTNAVIPGKADIVYLGFDPSTLTNTLTPVANSIKLSVAPNPASVKTDLSFTLDKSGQLNIDLFNVSGQKVLSQNSQGFEGYNVVSLQTGGLQTGMYYVRMQTGDKSGFVKLMIAK